MTDSAIVAEIHDYLDKAEWYEVYDFAEDIYQSLIHKAYLASAADFKQKLNRYFEKHNICWKFVDKTLEVRSTHLIDIDRVDAALTEAKLPTALAKCMLLSLIFRQSPHPT